MLTSLSQVHSHACPAQNRERIPSAGSQPQDIPICVPARAHLLAGRLEDALADSASCS